MKTAVIGTGKTGSIVLDLLDETQVIGPFNTGNPPDVEALQTAEVAIIFIPGSAVNANLEIVLEAEIPAVWGSTGYEWQYEKLDKQLKRQNSKWLRASNFSLGMQVVRRCIQMMGEGAKILHAPQFRIHEIHHAGKKDAPSGTALSWKKWLGRDVKITSERKGDIKGMHQLEMETPFETVQLKHEAKDRAVFAEGALWAAQQLLKPQIEPGFYTMEKLFDSVFTTKTQNI